MQHYPDTLTLNEIVTDVAVGALALPEFQRNFLWDGNRVTDLLESLSNGWPIGTFLLLEGPQSFGLKAIQDGPEPHQDRVRHYLLDGQQRATSIYHALTDTGDTRYYVDLAEGNEDDPPPFRWRKTKNLPSESCFTVAQLLSDDVFDYEMSLRNSATRAKFLSTRNLRLGSLQDPALRIPTIVMTQEIELEALTRIFETLNRTGLRLNAFDLMVAILYPTGINLRKLWEDAVDREPLLEAFDVDGVEVLKLCALRQRDREAASKVKRPKHKRVLGVRQRDVLNIPGSDLVEFWPDALTDYLAAIGFVVTEGVLNGKSVPSSAMLLTIASGIRSRIPLDQMRRWFWGSLLKQSYAQGANTQVVIDVDRGLEPVSVDTLEAEAASALNDQARRNRVLRLAVRAHLMTSGAKDPITGDPLVPPIREVSLQKLEGGRIESPRTEPVTDMALINESSVRALRILIDAGEWRAGLMDEAMSSQFFDVGASASEWTAGRELRLSREMVRRA